MLIVEKELKNGINLKQCGVSNGDTLVWHAHAKAAAKGGGKATKINLKLQHLNSDQVFEVASKRSNKIYCLKQEIYKKQKALKGDKLNMEEIVIYHDGKQLDEMQTIHSYELQDGQTLIWYTDIKKIIRAKSSKKANQKAPKECPILC